MTPDLDAYLTVAQDYCKSKGYKVSKNGILLIQEAISKLIDSYPADRVTYPVQEIAKELITILSKDYGSMFDLCLYMNGINSWKILSVIIQGMIEAKMLKGSSDDNFTALEEQDKREPFRTYVECVLEDYKKVRFEALTKYQVK